MGKRFWRPRTWGPKWRSSVCVVSRLRRGFDSWLVRGKWHWRCCCLCGLCTNWHGKGGFPASFASVGGFDSMLRSSRAGCAFAAGQNANARVHDDRAKVQRARSGQRPRSQRGHAASLGGRRTTRRSPWAGWLDVHERGRAATPSVWGCMDDQQPGRSRTRSQQQDGERLGRYGPSGLSSWAGRLALVRPG